MNPLIEARALKQYFPLKQNTLLRRKDLAVKANDGITLTIFEGETFGLVGESGCGKSTFGRTLLQLYRPTSGQVLYYRQGSETPIDLAECDERRLRPLRRELQLIFQDPYSSLNPRMTVGQIIGESLLAHRIFEKPGEDYRNYVQEVMERCGLASYMIHRYPHQFSGGQRQRIGIARALAPKPRFVVCDEAVSALDVSIQSQIINLLLELKEQEALTYLFISHDLSVVKYISDRIGVMYLGVLVEVAPTEHLFSHPSHPYTEALLSAIPRVEGKQTQPILLEGDLPSPVHPPQGCKFHTRCPYAQQVCAEQEPELLPVCEGHLSACHFREQRYQKGAYHVD